MTLAAAPSSPIDSDSSLGEKGRLRLMPVLGGFREIVKPLVESALVESGFCELVRQLRPPYGVILAYHNVIPAGEEVTGEYSLHIQEERFREHLDVLGRTHDVVPLEALLDGRRRRTSGRPPAAVTFDDAYRGAITVGVSQAVRRGFPVTVFVAPRLLGTKGFWWDRMAGEDGVLAEATRSSMCSHAGDASSIPGCDSISGEDSPQTDSQLPPHARPASVEELDLAVSRGGVSVGSHTWSHPSLPRCSETGLDKELRKPDRWLRQRYESAYCPCLAYPFGHLDDYVVQRVRKVYQWAVRVDGGVWRDPSQARPYTIPRVNISRNVSADGVELRTSGVL